MWESIWKGLISKALWWRADVVDIDEESEDGNNPDFFVSYEDCDDDQSDWYLVPLKEDYLKGWVRFVDVE